MSDVSFGTVSIDIRAIIKEGRKKQHMHFVFIIKCSVFFKQTVTVGKELFWEFSNIDEILFEDNNGGFVAFEFEITSALILLHVHCI